MLLCMSFPIMIIPGHAFDLRQIPFIFVFLYLGRVPGSILFSVLVAFRLYMGGDGVYIAILVNVVLFAMLLYVEPNFKKRGLKQKAIIVFSLSILKPVAMLIYFPLFYEMNRVLSLFTVQVFFFQTAGLLLTLHFIERMKSNIKVQEQVKQAEKRQVVSDLAASFAHEIRNPLTVTRGFVQLLKQKGLPENKREEFIQLALDEVDNAERIITNYLSFAKPGIEKPEQLNIANEVVRCCSIMKPYANMHGVDVRLNAGPSECSCVIVGQAQTFQQCLTNILKNCVEAMPRGGNIDLAISRESDNVYVLIQDEGIGMDKEKLERLGEPFYSTKEKGTGLGMMVVFSIIDAMNGDLHIDSKVDEGTKFLMRFPVIENNPKPLISNEAD
ncbi:ATP-binding protein [Bacillus tianshenii]|nr:ATP-binding protein [Bacillus tianshenii]